MNRVGNFGKISYKQFFDDVIEIVFHGDRGAMIRETEVETFYNAIKIPKRSTKGSAGYDFVSPFSFYLEPGQSITIPTGIKCKIEPGWFLAEFPRSSLGFKYRLQFDNTVGIIDEDFYNNETNEGHIMIKATNDTNENKTLHIDAGDRIAQAIFIPYGITYDDDATGLRTGGIGSTGR